MAIRISIIVSLTLLAYLCSTKVIPPEDMMCPIDCHCYYHGINWQTDCSESNMKTVPIDRIDSNVYTLIMDTNHLEKIDPFPHNIKVRSLQLSHNSLTTIQKETFAGLRYLLDVGLSSNLINYVHPEAFIENAGFITLQLQNNPLKPVEGPFLNSKTLRFLYLANCQLTALSHQFFTKINGLIKVDLSRNPLRIVEASTFDPIITLKHLILNKCHLTQISSVTPYHNSVLVLNNTNLKSDIHWNLIVGKLFRLEHLELKQSGISSLPENIFSNYIYLRRLVLADNLLSDSDLNTTLGQNIANIDYLDLSNCTLRAPLSKYAFGKATKLRTLILSRNFLSTSGLGEALSPLSKLTKLSLSNCLLSELPANTFQYLTNLKELDLSMNPMYEFYSGVLSIKNRLDSLEHLNMSYTNVDVIQRLTDLKMTGLKTLILSGNCIKSFKSGFLNNLPRLVLFECNNCGLAGPLESTLFKGISDHPVLEQLIISRNKIQLSERITFTILTKTTEYVYFDTYLPKLRTLDMSYCNLIYYTEDFQKYSPSLNRLLLNNNNIGLTGALDITLLYNPLVFEYLDLSYNKFSIITFGGRRGYRMGKSFIQTSNNITSLNLFGNPWKCDCSISTMSEWAKQGVVGTHLSNSSNKQSKSLVCNFDPNIRQYNGSLNPDPLQPCPAVGSECTSGVQYTWDRYNREFKNFCSCLLYHLPSSDCHYGMNSTFID